MKSVTQEHGSGCRVACVAALLGISYKKALRLFKYHYLVRLGGCWMDPWLNYSIMKTVKSGFRKKLPGRPQWIIYLIK